MADAEFIKRIIALEKEIKNMNEAINIGAANRVDVEFKVADIINFLKEKYPGETP